MSSPEAIPLRDRITAAADEILAEEGFAGVTFDAVAKRLGVTKQAVIYWFPSKDHLLHGLVLPSVREEAEVAAEAVATAGNGAEAMAAFVRAVGRWNLSDLQRFRLTYVGNQSARQSKLQLPLEAWEQIFESSGAMYAALERKLAEDPAWRKTPPPRRQAFAAHAATLGIVLMEALAESIEEPHKHSAEEALDALALMLARSGG